MKILAIVGSYRKGGTSDTAVEEILAAARQAGAQTEKIFLVDYRLQYCTNCRACTQKCGEEPGLCVLDDEMGDILAAIDSADGLILASPVNVGTVTAVMKTFLERLVCCAYWPWGQAAPTMRSPQLKRRAVLVISSAAPGFMTRWLTSTASVLKKGATFLGAKTVGTMYIGLAAQQPGQELTAGTRRRARRMAKELIKDT